MLCLLCLYVPHKALLWRSEPCQARDTSADCQEDRLYELGRLVCPTSPFQSQRLNPASTRNAMQPHATKRKVRQGLTSSPVLVKSLPITTTLQPHRICSLKRMLPFTETRLPITMRWTLMWYRVPRTAEMENEDLRYCFTLGVAVN